MNKTTIYLVRHAQSHPSTSKYHTDWPLSEIGKSQAEELSNLLASIEIDKVIGSPYLRCKQTINPFIKKQNLQYHVDDDFRERLISKEIIDGFYEVWSKSWEDFDYSLPECESSRTAQTRFVKAVQKHIELNQTKNILISTHGNVIGLFLNWIHKNAGQRESENLRNPDLIKVTIEDGVYTWDKDFNLKGIDEIATDYKETKVD